MFTRGLSSAKRRAEPSSLSIAALARPPGTLRVPISQMRMWKLRRACHFARGHRLLRSKSWDSASGVIPRPPSLGREPEACVAHASWWGWPHVFHWTSAYKVLRWPQTTASAYSSCAVFRLGTRVDQIPPQPSWSSGAQGGGGGAGAQLCLCGSGEQIPRAHQVLKTVKMYSIVCKSYFNKKKNHTLTRK